ncbi:hypothetical protein L596_007186 [Steinernema carpocapsae]|uniref:Uncharacterized protein n=1 Tax=Steinernema carpocapsae TaxID=34508 RepID=A0A4U5P8K2_STECR|nr:hypothetical protein L596_007186 [Steinernema carpocapsae]
MNAVSSVHSPPRNLLLVEVARWEDWLLVVAGNVDLGKGDVDNDTNDCLLTIAKRQQTAADSCTRSVCSS